MQIRFVGLDIYSPGDDSDLTMVISCKDGQLELIYSCESWARSTTEVDFYGCISSSGSGGAGVYLFGMGYIDGNGDVRTVYDAESLWGWWTSYISETAYYMAFEYEPDIEIISKERTEGGINKRTISTSSYLSRFWFFRIEQSRVRYGDSMSPASIS